MKINAKARLLASTQLFRYAMVNRPVGIGCNPKDVVDTEPRPAAGKPHHDMARNGIAIFHRKLTDQETKNFEMALLVDNGDPEMEVYVKFVIEELGEYAGRYAQMADKNFKQFEDKVYQLLKKVPGYMPSLDVAYFAHKVHDQIPRSNEINED